MQDLHKELCIGKYLLTLGIWELTRTLHENKEKRSEGGYGQKYVYFSFILYYVLPAAAG
jgi:hypothetical protein